MKSSRVNYVVVGVFVLAILAGLVASVALLTGRTGATESYYATYRNVTGVKFGTQVLYEGFPIGQVEEVTPEPQEGGMRFRVDLSVVEGWRIPTDSIAEIAAPGLLAAITISIRAGDSTSALVPGSELQAREASNIFAVLSSVAGDVTELTEGSLKPLIANLNETVGIISELMNDEIKALLGQITEIAGDVAERTPRIAELNEAVVGKLDRSSDEIAELVKPENRKKLEAILGNMDKAAGNFTKLTSDLEETRLKLESLLASVEDIVIENKEGLAKSLDDLGYITDSTARHIDAVNQNLEGAARNMYEPTFPIYHPNSWKSYHFPTAKGTVSPMQPSDGMILVIGPRLEGHSVIFLAIQTHLSCRFLLAVDSLGLRRSGSSSQIINQAQDFPEQVPRHRHLSQLERNVAAMSDNLGPDLHQLVAQRRHRPVLHLLRQSQCPHEVAQIVGQGVKLEPNGIVAELAT